MKTFKSKKGTEILENWPFWIIFTLAVGAVGLIIYNIANASVEEAAKIPEDLEDELILASRFYNSDGCFAYEDDVGRAYIKTIDQSKFTQENMNKCFQGSVVKYAYSLSLEQSPLPAVGPVWSFGTIQIKTSNYPTEGYPNKELNEDIIVVYEHQKYNGKLIIKIKNV